MTAAEVHAAAAAEGRVLLRAENSTGFKNVYPKSSTSKPFQAQLRQSRLTKNLGSFATAEEAALAVARFLGPKRVAAALAPEPEPMTAAEARAAAGAEGLSLVRASNPSGFKGVCRNGKASKPFHATLCHTGRNNHLGSFATAEEAALAVARELRKRQQRLRR